MTDKLTIGDVEQESAKRDETGELVAESREIQWKGGTREVRVYPATLGHGNKFASIEDRLREADPEAVAEVLQGMYAEPDFGSQSKDQLVEWLRDLPMARMRELTAPLNLGAEAGEGEGNPQTEAEARATRARQMRGQ